MCQTWLLPKQTTSQPYLFKFIQEQDAGAEINVSIEVSSSAGISQETLERAHC